MIRTPFKDNAVILTGASKGIGEQLAYRLAEQGACLALAARGAEKLEAVAEECRKRGAQAISVPTDVTDEAQCKRLVERAVETYGRVDTLLNNAGYGYPRRFEALPDLITIKSETALNYLGLVHCVYYALPHLRHTRGRIVAVSSFGGLVGLPGTIGYNASKHALRGFLDTLRAELLGTGVTVTVVYPGAVRTERLYETMGDRVRTVPSMSPERCAEITLDAGAKRKRQVIMTLEGKVLLWLSRVIPGILDRHLVRLSNLYEE
jgi:short-subunit dehydrogenase